MDKTLSRRGLFKVTAGGLAVYSLLPPAEALAALTEPVKRYFPLDSTMLRQGWYDLYLEPTWDFFRPGITARWYDGEALLAEATLGVETVIADEPYHALSPLASLTQDFVGPQAKLQRAFFKYPGGEGPTYRNIMAAQRLLDRVEAMKDDGVPMAKFNPGFDTNPPIFTGRAEPVPNRPIWGVDTRDVRL